MCMNVFVYSFIRALASIYICSAFVATMLQSLEELLLIAANVNSCAHSLSVCPLIFETVC